MYRLIGRSAPFVVQFKDKIVEADRVATGALHRRSMQLVEAVSLLLAIAISVMIIALVWP